MAKQYVSNKDETLRLFKSDFFEFFSRVHFTVPLFLFIPVILYCLYLSIFELRFAALAIAAWSLFGLVIWTFTEYTLHRFVFHFTPHGKILETIHFMVHGVHHDYPNDALRLVMPPSVSIPLSIGFYLLFGAVISTGNLAAFFPGFLAGYLFYDISHYAIHHGNFTSNFWKRMKQHHMLHHYSDPDKGYGVSSRLWDMVFGSDFSKK